MAAQALHRKQLEAIEIVTRLNLGIPIRVVDSAMLPDGVQFMIVPAPPPVTVELEEDSMRLVVITSYSIDELSRMSAVVLDDAIKSSGEALRKQRATNG